MSSNSISFYGIGIEEPTPDVRELNFYGIGIEESIPDIREINFYGIGIEESPLDIRELNFYGIGIEGLVSKKEKLGFYGIGIEESLPDSKSLNFYGIGVEFLNLIRQQELFLYGLGIEANNYFGAKIKIIDGSNGDVIDEALVTATSTDLPSNHIGNVVQNTNSEGIIDLRGFSTLGNNLKIEKEGYQTYNLPLPSYKLSGIINIALFPESNESGFKKFYVTNKGKVLLNPSNDILFELD